MTDITSVRNSCSVTAVRNIRILIHPKLLMKVTIGCTVTSVSTYGSSGCGEEIYKLVYLFFIILSGARL